MLAAQYSNVVSQHSVYRRLDKIRNDICKQHWTNICTRVVASASADQIAQINMNLYLQKMRLTQSQCHSQRFSHPIWRIPPLCRSAQTKSASRISTKDSIWQPRHSSKIGKWQNSSLIPFPHISDTHVQMRLGLPVGRRHTRDQHASQCAGRRKTDGLAAQYGKYAAQHHHQKANRVRIILKCDSAS